VIDSWQLGCCGWSQGCGGCSSKTGGEAEGAKGARQISVWQRQQLVKERVGESKQEGRCGKGEGIGSERGRPRRIRSGIGVDLKVVGRGGE
jgi:hypothetical protein